MQQVNLASKFGAFALFVTEGAALAWGHGELGCQVREQLVRVQQIQSTDLALAAILADSSVVTWGKSDCGGDSCQVREQLVRVQHIQATEDAFAAILEDGSVVTWAIPPMAETAAR